MKFVSFPRWRTSWTERPHGTHRQTKITRGKGREIVQVGKRCDEGKPVLRTMLQRPQLLLAIPSATRAFRWPARSQCPWRVNENTSEQIEERSGNRRQLANTWTDCLSRLSNSIHRLYSSSITFLLFCETTTNFLVNHIRIYLNRLNIKTLVFPLFIFVSGISSDKRFVFVTRDRQRASVEAIVLLLHDSGENIRRVRCQGPGHGADRSIEQIENAGLWSVKAFLYQVSGKSDGETAMRPQKRSADVIT